MAHGGQSTCAPTVYRMPLSVPRDAPTMFVRKQAWERSGLSRAAIDARFALTPEEFRVEGAVVAIGPLAADDHLGQLTEMLEGAGLIYFEDFFELSGNWPEWLAVHITAN
jgi:hypothetical protein